MRFHVQKAGKSKGCGMSRMIHKEISRSKKIASLSKESLILFTMLIPHFNAHGKMNGEPHFIKGEVLPLLKWATVDIIKKCLTEINATTNVKWYVVDELYYLQSLNWTDHQNLRSDRMGEDKLPAYSMSSTGLVPHEAKVSISKDKKKSKGNPADGGKCVEIIDFLNQTINASYKPTAINTIKVIKARLAEGYAIKDFKQVITIKAEEWTGTEFAKFLRPETLFGNKFDGYLNQKKIKALKSGNGKRTHSELKGFIDAE